MSQFYQLDFEKPVREIQDKIRSLESVLSIAESAESSTEPSPVPTLGVVGSPPDQVRAELDELNKSYQSKLIKIYKKLRPWDVVRVARHPNRPQTRDYINSFCRDFVELHGDRRFGDDPALVTGFGRIGPHKCLIIGHQKGKDTAEKIACHFGCAHPEGYRKALAKMKLAEKFGIPIVTLVDTPGAYPGIGAEQRGQAEAIAVNLREMSRLRTPIVSIVIGEGGSGGALGIAVSDRVAMLSNSWYSVISPEGCAAILWKQANETTNNAAANALKLTAKDNLELGIVDDVIAEPVGGAHRDTQATSDRLESWITSQLASLKPIPIDDLLNARYERFRRLGRLSERPIEDDSSGDSPSCDTGPAAGAD